MKDLITNILMTIIFVSIVFLSITIITRPQQRIEIEKIEVPVEIPVFFFIEKKAYIYIDPESPPDIPPIEPPINDYRIAEIDTTITADTFTGNLNIKYYYNDQVFKINLDGVATKTDTIVVEKQILINDKTFYKKAEVDYSINDDIGVFTIAFGIEIKKIGFLLTLSTNKTYGVRTSYRW